MLRASVWRIHTPAQEVSWLTASINNNPFKFGVGVTTAKTVCADMFVQRVIEKRDWDARRTMLFACFGFLFQGSFQYGLINWVIEPTFPGKSLRNIVTKILCMNLIVDPILFLPTFYSFKEAMVEERVGFDVIRAALVDYSENFWEDWMNSWMIWFPGHVVTIPWMSILSFGYVCVLSCTRGQIDEPAEAPQQAEEKAKLRRNLSRRASIVGIRIHDSEDPRVVARKKLGISQKELS